MEYKKDEWPRVLQTEQRNFLLYCKQLTGFTEDEYTAMNVVIKMNSYHPRHMVFFNQLRDDKMESYLKDRDKLNLRNKKTVERIKKMVEKKYSKPIADTLDDAFDIWG